MTFGETLKQLREVRRISQSKLGHRAGFDHSYVSRLEDGTRQPSRATVMALAAALELSDVETDELRQAAGFSPRIDPDVERFRRLPPEVRRAVLDLIEKARIPA